MNASEADVTEATSADETNADGTDTETTAVDGATEYGTDSEKTLTSPKTGDESHLVLWGSLFVCSLAAFGVVLIGRRKR